MHAPGPFPPRGYLELFSLVPAGRQLTNSLVTEDSAANSSEDIMGLSELLVNCCVSTKQPGLILIVFVNI